MFSKKIIFRILIFYIIGIVALCVVPLNTKGELNHVTIAGIRGDYFFHILMFLPFFPITRLGVLHAEKKNILLLLFLSGFALAIFAESLQLFVPYRSFNLKDMAANCVGVIIGSFVFFIKSRIK